MSNNWLQDILHGILVSLVKVTTHLHLALFYYNTRPQVSILISYRMLIVTTQPNTPCITWVYTLVVQLQTGYILIIGSETATEVYMQKSYCWQVSMKM